MKLKVSGEWMEQKNGRSAHRKYAIRGFERHLPSYVSVAIDAGGVIFFVLLLH